ncbi:glycoside hydrolase family 13 protein [Salsuginibacillus kocurii]|uniref:glycoside hydrolase family 13 protein n=1 Tax=Salsuginibacillus kocurii TaxID=427078 RepID=UPI00037E934E|nr:alpha-glucosidase [Salsuginibacillus kocurii]
MKREWWKEAVGYQIYPRSFQDSNGDGIGDLRGIIERLDYVKELGIDFIWVCPFYRSPKDDNGYDISDYKAIQEEFGTMEDFDLLLEEVHARGMKLIIDLVLNHTSDEHHWFIESRSSRDDPKRDWYIWRDGKDGAEPNNWESIFGGSAWEYEDWTGQYYLHLFSVKQPDLNWENHEVRRELYNTVNWWLDKGIDGFRIDAITHIKKRPGLPDMPNPDNQTYVPSFAMHMNQEGIHEFLQEFKEETYSKYDALTVGEANGVSIEEAPLWVGETGKMDMIFQFEHLNLWGTDNKLDVLKLKEVLTAWQKGLENKGWNALFIENHDQPRVVSTWGDDKDYWRESATALATMYFFMQGTPFIYQGQEIGMTNAYYTAIEDYDDVAAKNLFEKRKADGDPPAEIIELLGQTSRDNSRTPMQWSAGENAGFTSANPWLKLSPNYTDINVEKQSEDPNSVLNYYKAMITLKKTADIFTYGSYDLLLPDDERLYVYTRTLPGQEAVIIANLSEEKADIDASGELELQNDNTLVLHNQPLDGEKQLGDRALKPYEARVYIREK